MRDAIRRRVRAAIGEDRFAAFRGIYWSFKLRLTGYEPETEALPLFVHDGAVCIDVGGNFGQFASFLSRAAGARGTVHSFEPLAYNRRIFEVVVRRMQLRNVTVHPYGAGAARATLRFDVPDRNTAEAHVSESGSETIEVVALDEWASGEGLSRLDFVKIDVEGFEMEVMRGAANLLARFYPAILCEISGVSEERYGVAATEPFRFLRSIGYGAFVWRRGELCGVDGPQPGVINYFFVHDAKGLSGKS